MSRSMRMAWVVVVVSASVSSAQVTQRVSLSSQGAQALGYCYTPAISADGRYEAFESMASNLVPGDTNGDWDIFVRDRQLGTTERVSVATGGAQANGFSLSPSISDDGRYVAFYSPATNLVAGDSNGTADIFVRDRLSGTTELASVDSSGAQGNLGSGWPSISADGRFVAFESYASNLASGDTNGFEDIYLRDRQLGTTERVSLSSTGTQADGDCYDASVSADGRIVAFESWAENLVPGGFVFENVYARDRQSGTTQAVGVTPAGTPAGFQCYGPAVSADGRFVGFYSQAPGLVAGDTNARLDVFLRDLQTGTTERVSVDSNGVQGNDHSGKASISADGRYVAFGSFATNFEPGDVNGSFDVFVRDRQSGSTEIVSVDSTGRIADGPSSAFSISANGLWVVFDSYATNLVPGDTNFAVDIFVRDRLGGPAFASLCDPGTGGVIACPCGNPPAGSGRGCDNSSATGGAALEASGGTYLSSDSLVLTTNGQTPTALSIVLQGNASVPAGAVYGQGVRCAGGTLKRLYTKVASSGSITAPDFEAGDPSVSARSAARGDPIQIGQSRWYLVYYRDPIVLGGCPATSTFNATQTGEAVWSP